MGRRAVRAYPARPDRFARKIGQQLVAQLCRKLKLVSVLGEAQSPWDIRIEGSTFELKTATEGENLTFQFNHVRYHRSYDFLLCVGITPCDIVFDAWTKADVVTGKAGHLVTMEKGANASYKLTKRACELRPIGQFKSHILELAETP